MASAPTLPTRPTNLVRSPESDQENEALASVSEAPEDARLEVNQRTAVLPIELDVAIPVRNFKVRNLIALTKGHVVESQWDHGEDLPLAAGDVQLAWCEFEVIESRLAVRITRLA